MDRLMAAVSLAFACGLGCGLLAFILLSVFATSWESLAIHITTIVFCVVGGLVGAAVGALGAGKDQERRRRKGLGSK